MEFLKDNEWICTEKIDGMNIGIVWDGHAVSYQGRTERAEIPTGLLNTLEECFGGSINEELFEQKFGEMPVILFGEGYGRKIQVKRGYKFKPKFINFGILFHNPSSFLKYLYLRTKCFVKKAIQKHYLIILIQKSLCHLT